MTCKSECRKGKDSPEMYCMCYVLMIIVVFPNSR